MNQKFSYMVTREEKFEQEVNAGSSGTQPCKAVGKIFFSCVFDDPSTIAHLQNILDMSCTF